MNNLNRKHYYILGIWLVINLLQSIFTGLHSDESYYWMYSENLDWGYFDHPPMAALLIHLGHLLIPGETGVRIIIILLSTITLAFIMNELNEQEDYFFLTVFVLSFPLIHTHIAGFLAIPDIPLLFFTVLFLVLYRNFLQQPNLRLSLLIGITVAAMIYSKYHAFLIIGFTVLSNLKLLTNKYFWLAVVFALILLVPHGLWQMANEYPTFKYHLIERAKPFRLKYVFPYLLNQLLVAGPLTGVLVFRKLAKVKPVNQFQRTLFFNILGFYILFFLLSFKNRIEAHWTAAVIPMLMLLTYPLITSDTRFKIWFKKLAIPVIVLMFFYRAYLALDIIPDIGNAKTTFYNREEHAMEIKEMADGKKVGFYNNYAAISNYIFYTGDSAVHLSTPGYRFCQYDLWNEEKYANGDPLFAVQSKHLDPPNLTRMATGQLKGFLLIEEFQSLNGLLFQLDQFLKDKENLHFRFTLKNANKRSIHTRHISNPCLGIMQNGQEVHCVPLTCSSEKYEIKSNESAVLQFKIPAAIITSDQPVFFYTRTKNNIRGEVAVIDLSELNQ
ncbi:MAG: ArnT family glycosyltransferase [Prolixibacteraceae bacterium]